MPPKLLWRGAQVNAKLLAAAVEGINETTKAAAEDAQSNHWWRSRTGRLDDQIITEPAMPGSGGITGKFGSTRGPGFYGLILEYRKPFLRPAADGRFPELAGNIRKRFR